MLGVLSNIGKSLLGDLFTKGVSTLGNVARKALDTYIPIQNDGEFQGKPNKSDGREYAGDYNPSSAQEYEGSPNLPTKISSQHRVFGQRLDRLESGVDKLRKRIRK